VAGCATTGDVPIPPQAATGGLECQGVRSSRPTVILESGAFGGAADWALVARDLARSGKVCAYDRDGVGLAARHDLDRSPIAIAARLEALVAREEGDAPVILAGHSNGGLYVEAFARRWPERTAGLLLVDAVGTDVRDHPLALADLAREQRLTRLAPFARAIGLSRLGFWLSDLHPPPQAAARRRVTWLRRASIQSASAEVQAFLAGLDAVEALPPLSRTIPVAVVVASRQSDAALDQDWRAAQVAPARRACRALVVDAWASHTSILDAQRGYVVALAEWLGGGPPASEGCRPGPPSQRRTGAS
jgi:pimeloyl-ACP methyl ester carboxylesterase